MSETTAANPNPAPQKDDWRKLVGLAFSGAVVASLCCLPSVVLVLFGLASVTSAAALSEKLYHGPARFFLYGISSVFVVAGLVVYFRSRGICTIDEARRQRTRVINITLLVAIIAVVGYLVWNYVILELAGRGVGLPW